MMEILQIKKQIINRSVIFCSKDDMFQQMNLLSNGFSPDLKKSVLTSTLWRIQSTNVMRL